jgi:hypothetical protein
MTEEPYFVADLAYPQFDHKNGKTYYWGVFSPDGWLMEKAETEQSAKTSCEIYNRNDYKYYQGGV